MYQHESSKHGEKPVTKAHTLILLTWKDQNTQIFKDRKYTSGGGGLENAGEEGNGEMGLGLPFDMM